MAVLANWWRMPERRRTACIRICNGHCHSVLQWGAHACGGDACIHTCAVQFQTPQTLNLAVACRLAGWLAAGKGIMKADSKPRFTVDGKVRCGAGMPPLPLPAHGPALPSLSHGPARPSPASPAPLPAAFLCAPPRPSRGHHPFPLSLHSTPCPPPAAAPLPAKLTSLPHCRLLLLLPSPRSCRPPHPIPALTPYPHVRSPPTTS